MGFAMPKVAVIGAGVVGVCCASYLQRSGCEVEIIDPAEPGSQCSFGNAGGVCPGSCVPISMPGNFRHVLTWLTDREAPLHIRLAHLPQAVPWLLRFLAAGTRHRVEKISDHMRALHRLTFECYEPLLKDAGCAALIEHHGQLFVYRDAAGIERDAYGLKLRQDRGVKVEILGQDELRQLEPSLSPSFTAAVFLPEQGQCRNPGRLVETLARYAINNGARFTKAKVTGFQLGSEGPSAVVTDNGAVPVEAVVLAAGAWSAALARQLGSRVPLESERGYHAVAEGADTGLRRQTVWADRKFVATPMEMGLRFAGTVELAGLDFPPNMRRADILLDQGKQMFPDLKVHSVSRWMGHRPGLPDTIPVISRSPHHKNVYFAFGHGHMGLIGASVTGRLIKDLMLDRPPVIDVTPYRVDRF